MAHPTSDKPPGGSGQPPGGSGKANARTRPTAQRARPPWVPLPSRLYGRPRIRTGVLPTRRGRKGGTAPREGSAPAGSAGCNARDAVAARPPAVGRRPATFPCHPPPLGSRARPRPRRARHHRRSGVGDRSRLTLPRGDLSAHGSIGAGGGQAGEGPRPTYRPTGRSRNRPLRPAPAPRVPARQPLPPDPQRRVRHAARTSGLGTVRKSVRKESILILAFGAFAGGCRAMWHLLYGIAAASGAGGAVSG